MRLPQRLIAAAVLIALSGALAGCGGGGLGNFDPTDLLDWLDTKKKLPGDRKPVFPEGVPGLDQGVPKDLYKGAAQQQVDPPNPQTAAATPAEPPKSKRAAKSKAKQPDAAEQPAAAAEPDPAAEEGGTAAAPPAPISSRPPRRRSRRRRNSSRHRRSSSWRHSRRRPSRADSVFHLGACASIR
jgi:hypothetical protein